ncbi:MAG: hypothetical protein A2143_00695 [Gallionellales bacterium RBG_16_57_15]|nr:MAG: hypothetical protein A2143_00695 [Gallionellales bacterium RBG_16_57_15]
MYLTKHFSLEELTASDTATRLGIDNTPVERVIENLRKTAVLAEQIRTALTEECGRSVPLNVLSGHRCEVLEKMLCARDYMAWCARRNMPWDDATWSMYFGTKGHPDGRCIDFKAPAFGTPLDIVGFISTKPVIMQQIDQIIMEGVTKSGCGWVHVGWSDNPRRQVKTATFDSCGTPTYTDGIV